MPEDKDIIISWPGVTDVKSLQYMPAVGISPQCANLVIIPGASAPAMTGSLTFGVTCDGVVRSLTLTGCHVAPNGFRSRRDRSGELWDLAIMDRRWKWIIGPPISGNYNQRDRRNKLIPWSVRSPYQLAMLCLEAMGERAYLDEGEEFSIDLPAGLAAERIIDPDAPPEDPEAEPPVPPTYLANPPDPGPNDVLVDVEEEYLNTGENTPQTGTNQPVDWTEIPAAVALDQLCQAYGRVVVWNPVTNKTSIQKIGFGTPPPAGDVFTESPSIDPKQVPSVIRVVGSPTRYQTRLKFRAVGQDWDDSWHPLSELSFAPDMTPQKMKVAAAFFHNQTAKLFVNGVEIGEGTAADHAASINSHSDPFIAGKLTASTSVTDTGNHPILVIEAVDYGYEFNCWALMSDGSGGWTEAANVSISCVAGPIPEGKGFYEQYPPVYPRVQATERLSYPQAQQLAESTVHSCFQLVAVDPFNSEEKTIPLPKLPPPPPPPPPPDVPPPPPDPFTPDRVSNRYRLIIQPTRAEQIAPRPGDENRVDPRTGRPFAAEQYNGYSRDRAPQSFGGIYVGIQSGGFWSPGFWQAGKPVGLHMTNLPTWTAFYIPFSIVDNERQVIRYSQPIFRVLGGERSFAGGLKIPQSVHGNGRPAIVPADPVVETAVIVLDKETYTPNRYTYDLAIPGALGPIKSFVRPEVQLELIGEFDEYHKMTGSSVVDADAQNRASILAAQLAIPYQTSGAYSVQYTEFIEVHMSGLTRSIGWVLSKDGMFTVAASNSEISANLLPPLPERRRREALAADPTQALQNLASQPEVRNAADKNAAAGAAIAKGIGMR